MCGRCKKLEGAIVNETSQATCEVAWKLLKLWGLPFVVHQQGQKLAALEKTSHLGRGCSWLSVYRYVLR